MIDFRLPAEAEALRAELRALFAEHLTDEVLDHELRTGDGHHWEFHQVLARHGLALPTWPVEEGGRGLDPYGHAVLFEELYYAGAPLVGLNTTQLPATVLRVFGTEQQRTEVLPRVARGEVIICLGFSEPEVGSDVAAVRTRATRVDGGWRIDGQKMFTTFAHLAQYCFLLARTNADAAKHAGLTMFLVPLDAPGVEIQPLRTTAGERTNIVFYNGVHVDDSARIGEIDGGWHVIGKALELEHQIGSFWGAKQRMFEAAVAAAAILTDADGSRLITKPRNRERLGRVAAHNEVTRLLNHRTAWMAAEGRSTTVEGAVLKLFATETFVEDAGELLAMLAPDSTRTYAGDPADAVGLVEHSYRYAAGTTVYGGSSEVMRGIVAERGLGMPRSR